jgi:mannose-6-phosphate isomerase-like protein (cupin superfamily)
MGELIFENGSTTLMPGNAVFVPGEELHQFRNRGEGIFKFLCIVPNEGHS